MWKPFQFRGLDVWEEELLLAVIFLTVLISLLFSKTCIFNFVLAI